jgi:drug/metabolite transporter (DMT)-like permease
MKKGYIYSITAAILFGSAGLLVKMAQGTGIDSISLLTVQYMLAVTIMFSFAFLKDRKSLIVDRKSLFNLAVLGVVGNTFMTTFYYMAFEYLPVAMVTMLLYTYPIIVLIFTCFFEKKNLNLKKIIAIAIAFLGCLCALNIIGGKFIYSREGIVFGLLSAVFYAFMNIYSEKKLYSVNSLAINAYSTLFSLAALCLYKFPFFIFRVGVQSDSFIYIILLAIFSEILPLTLLYAAIKYIGSLKVSIISNLEIPTAMLAAFIFLNEKITIVQFFGSVLIIYAIYLIRDRN